LLGPVALLLFCCGLSHAADPQDPVFSSRDVFELEYASDPRISPDGTQVVYLRNAMNIMTDRREARLWIVDVDGTHHRQLTEHDRGVSQPRWSPDGTRVAFVAATEHGAEIFVRWMDSGQTARLTRLPHSPNHLAWSPDASRIAFTMLVEGEAASLVKPPRKPKGATWAEPPRVITEVIHERDGVGYLTPGFTHVFVVPAEGGTARQLTSGNFHDRGPLSWTPDGTALLFTANRNPDWEYAFLNTEIHRVDVEDGTITALTQRNGPDHHPVVSPDGSTVAYLSYEDRVQTYQVTELMVMRIDGSGWRSLTASLDRSVGDPQWDSDGKGLFFHFEDQGTTRIGHVGLDGDMRVVADDLGGTAAGRPYGGGSYTTSDRNVVAYTHTRPDHPADVAIVRRKPDDVRLITHLNADLLERRRLAQVEELWWESGFDQRRIQGWLVTPPDFDPSRRYPLLLEIHGGPTASYGPRFSSEIQLYAAAGYVVLYANPRGSVGYGEEFGNLLHHNYPSQDHDDLMTGIDTVLARGIVDVDSLFVTGGSAGGILTAWMVGKTDRFRAAAVVKPVINWTSKVLVADNWIYYHDYRYPGSPWENPEEYMAFSPLSLVGNISTPTMVMVGTEDLRTPLSEAKQLYHALKLRRIDTALVEIPGASHHIVRRPSHLVTKVAHVLGWFQRYRADAPSGGPDAPD
jgi:dipeptidyl aminopeptidase/acylaminoacyl peptidase